MLKTFALFGLICFMDNNQWGESCMNFWEEPVVHYKSLSDCDNAGKRKAIEIRAVLERNGLTITNGELWCIETTKGKKT